MPKPPSENELVNELRDLLKTIGRLEFRLTEICSAIGNLTKEVEEIKKHITQKPR